MSIETLIARWVAVIWLAFGLSHALQPVKWAALLFPLKERDTGGLLLASFSFPIGLAIILGHNVWVWDLPVIVTLMGWLTTIKCATYLLLPRAHTRVMSVAVRPEAGFRVVGILAILLGAVTAYDAFFRR